MIFFFFSTLQLCVLTHCLWFLAHKWWLQISQSVHFEGKRSAAGGFSKFQNCIHCVRMFLCFLCFHGAVSNRGRHDRVGKARERARGKGATRQAHPAGARRPGAGHRSQQVWTLLRRPRSPLPVWLGSARHGTAWPGPAQKAPKQSGDCTGLIQHHLLTPWRDSKLISNSFNPPTVHALLVSVVLIEERNVFSFPF